MGIKKGRVVDEDPESGAYPNGWEICQCGGQPFLIRADKVNKKMMTEAEIEYALSISYLFATKRCYEIIPVRNNGLISFYVEGENIEQALKEIYDNPQVGVMDFINCFHSVASTVFTIKVLK